MDTYKAVNTFDVDIRTCSLVTMTTLCMSALKVFTAADCSLVTMTTLCMSALKVFTAAD